MGYADKIYYTKTSFYNRYVRKGSAVNKYYSKMIELVYSSHSGIINAIDNAWNGNDDYKLAYEKQTLNLVFSAINNEFLKDAKGTFIQKYRNIKEICNKDEVRYSITILKRNDLRSRLILKKRIFFLIIIAIMCNLKHRR